MRQVISGIEQVLTAHPLVWPDIVVAKLANLGPATIDIELLCWIATTDYEAFRVARQEVLLAVMGVVEASGAHFAQLPPPVPPSA